MAAAKKKKKKKAKKSSKRKGRGRRGLTALLFMVGIVAALVVAGIVMKPVPEKPMTAQIIGRVGSKGAAAGQLNSPRGIAVDSQGDLYVADLGNSRINKYGPDGKFILSFGKPGDEAAKNGPGEFHEPSGVAVDKDGDVYVADAWNGRIQKFDSKGKFLMELGGARYSFYSPRNVAVDANGDIYVADTGNSVVKAYTAAGAPIKEIGGRGKGGGHFQEVFGLAIDSKGAIFVADPGNQRIHKFSALPEAKFIMDRKVPGWQEGTPFWPHLAIDAQDHVYAVDNTNHKIWVYDDNLNYLGTLGGSPGKEYFGAPLGVAVSGNELYVSDMANNMVLRLGNLGFPAPAPGSKP